MILGYGAHMWEMYGMRSWLAPFMTSALIGWGFESARATGFASTVAAVMVGIGAFSTAITGTLSDRFGRTATISMVMLTSALFSFGFGWLINTNLWLTLAIGILYGYLVVAESPVFSTGLTELVVPGYLGAAMGLQSLIGYSMGMISPTVFGWALDTFKGWQPLPGINGEWGVAFSCLGLGALAGPIFMWMLRKTPGSVKMAGGRR
jgi:MFS family permease